MQGHGHGPIHTKIDHWGPRSRNADDGELVPRSESLAGAAPWEAVGSDAVSARFGIGCRRSDELARAR